MSSRVSQYVLLCEDDVHEQLVRAYLYECGANPSRCLIAINASRTVHGGNVGWVLSRFAKELNACRNRQARARTLLIVVLDADDLTVAERRRELESSAGFAENDPLVVLIPKRHVETWIRAALGESVNEADSYKRPVPHKKDVRQAAKIVFGWARNKPAPGLTCVDSLRNSLSHWRKIG